MEIIKITELSAEDLASFGRYGYTADEQYVVERYQVNEELFFKVSKTTLTEPYIKEWESTADDFSYYHKTLKQGLSFGAYINDQLVGVALVERKSWNNSFVISLIHVSEQYQGQGIGSRLLAQVKETALTNQIRIISLETQNTNVNAIEFYKKNGYEIDSLDISLYDNNYPENEVAFFMKLKIFS